MSIALTFDAVSEDAPGPLWAATFARHWPSYRAWYLRNAAELPSYLECRRALREHMPELVPVWERLTELAGGGDVESRFLSMWCPPLYVVGCSQGVWLDRSGVDEPALLRNYDFAPALLEGNWLATRWTGPRVVAVADCGWGVLDGINEAGLVASLSFGGRSALGAGFGVPVVMRYLLEVAQTVPQAVKHLQRLPASMSYNITLLDARGEYATVYIAPDRACEVTRDVAVTNFQRQIEWPEHAQATLAQERLACLRQWLAAGAALADVAGALLAPPLYQTQYRRGFGTLYSAAYRPCSRLAELFWPGQRWVQSVAAFEAGSRQVELAPDAAPADANDAALLRTLTGAR